MAEHADNKEPNDDGGTAIRSVMGVVGRQAATRRLMSTASPAASERWRLLAPKVRPRDLVFVAALDGAITSPGMSESSSAPMMIDAPFASPHRPGPRP